MSATARRYRRAAQRHAQTKAITTAVRFGGCTCPEPWIRHLTAGHLRVEHDAGCPMEHHGSQLLLYPTAGCQR